MDLVSLSGLGMAWFRSLPFASWAEVAFAAVMLLPLLFFAACALYLLAAAANAGRERRRVVDSAPSRIPHSGSARLPAGFTKRDYCKSCR